MVIRQFRLQPMVMEKKPSLSKAAAISKRLTTNLTSTVKKPTVRRSTLEPELEDVLIVLVVVVPAARVALEDAVAGVVGVLRVVVVIGAVIGVAAVVEATKLI